MNEAMSGSFRTFSDSRRQPAACRIQAEMRAGFFSSLHDRDSLYESRDSS